MDNLLKYQFKCCGCGVCQEICPKNAIKLIENEEGFLEFFIDKEKCINCGLCSKKCPQLNNFKNRNLNDERNYYAAYVKNSEEILKSTSGGIFSIIAKKIALIEKYSIFGCTFDENMVAKHIYIEDINELDKILGSKYVQSDTRNIFSQVKGKLDSGNKVLFSGTPCQISALYSYLGEQEYENLYTIDLVCHGVPSPLLFKKYIKWLERKNKGKIEKYMFRNKDKKTWELLCSYDINGKRYYKYDSLDPYYNSFINGDTYRESCYECKYANKERVGDITLGDFWGIEDEYPEFCNKYGNSAIIINTKKGREIFDLIKNEIVFIESTYEKMSKKNHNLVSPSLRPDIRDIVYNNIKDKDFENIIKDNMNFKVSFKSYLKSKIPKNIKIKVKSLLKKR